MKAHLHCRSWSVVALVVAAFPISLAFGADEKAPPPAPTVRSETQEKEPVRIGEVKIFGNLETRDHVIRERVNLYPGQVLSYPDLTSAERSLSRLGIFEENQAHGIKPTVEVENPDVDEAFKNILVRVKEKPIAPNLALVPDDAAAFVTVRVAGVGEKLGLLGRDDKLSIMNDFKKTFGLSLDTIEQCTVVTMDFEEDGAILILRTAKPFKQRDILQAYLPGAKKVKILGKTCQVDADKGRAICFVDKQLLVVTQSRELLTRCLKQASGARGDQTLAQVLKWADKHDLAAWVKGTAVANAKAQLPSGIDSGSITLDIGAQLAINAKIFCSDVKSAKWAAKALQSCADTARLGLLALSVFEDANSLFPNALDKDVLKPLSGMTMDLPRRAERGLQQARVETEATDVSLAAEIAIDAKTLRDELASVIRAVGADSRSLGLRPWVAGMTLPSNRYLEHMPQYFPEEPDFPVKKELQYQNETGSAKAKEAIVVKPDGLLFNVGPDGGPGAQIGRGEQPHKGKLLITSEPMLARVVVGQQDIGCTPCDVDFCGFGRYNIELKLDGYETLVRHETIEPFSPDTALNTWSFHYNLDPVIQAPSAPAGAPASVGQAVGGFGAVLAAPKLTIENSDAGKSTGPGKLRLAGFLIDGKQVYALDGADEQVRFYLTAGKDVPLDAFINRQVELRGELQVRNDIRGGQYMVVSQVKSAESILPAAYQQQPAPVQAPYATPPRAPVAEDSGKVVTVGAQPVVAKTPMKLSVANVRKEAALLFTMADDGKLTFVQKVAAGDAVDVQTTTGQRWVAVFADKPDSETFTVTPAQAIWLLRVAQVQQFNFGGGFFN